MVHDESSPEREREREREREGEREREKSVFLCSLNMDDVEEKGRGGYK